MLLEHAFAHQVERGVECRLAAHGGQQRVGLFLLDDPRDGLPVDRLDVDGIGHLRVGHDRGGIGVHQDDAVALLAQRLARLGAGVIELAGLPDDDGAGADDQDALDVSSFGHSVVARMPTTCGRLSSASLQLRLQTAQHQVIETFKQRFQVVRTGARLGVSLEAERRPILEGQPLQRAIEQRAVSGLHVVGQGRLIDRETVILTRDEDPSGIEILHGVVRAMMTGLHFHGLRAGWQARVSGDRGRCQTRAAGRSRLEQLPSSR